MGDGVFEGGIARISVRNAVAAHLISSTMSLECGKVSKLAIQLVRETPFYFRVVSKNIITLYFVVHTYIRTTSSALLC